jgi:cobalt-zinc-cadmium efflux system protein
MAMSRAGDAGHVPMGGDRRAFILLGLLTGLYFVVELGVDPWSGSVAVTSDAFHTISAVGGFFIALVAQHLSERPASAEYSSGRGRAEIVGALFNRIFLVIMGGYVFSMGAMRHAEPIELATTVLLYTAFGGIVIELIAFRLLNERQKDNLNIKGAFWHIIQTFIGSLIIIHAGHRLHALAGDGSHSRHGVRRGPVLVSWTIVHSALRILLQSTPEDFNVKAAIAALEGRGREGCPSRACLERDLRTQPLFPHISASRVCRGRRKSEASQRLKQLFQVYFSTPQNEEDCLSGEEGAAAIDISRRRRPVDHAKNPHPPSAARLRMIIERRDVLRNRELQHGCPQH